MKPSDLALLKQLLLAIFVASIFIFIAVFATLDGPRQNPIVGKTLTEIIWGGKK